MKCKWLIMTQLSGVASIIFSCLKMGMCSPMELNSPTIVAILTPVDSSHLTNFSISFFLLATALLR